MAVHIYTSPTAPFLKFRSPLDRTKIEFQHGKFETENDELAAAIDKLLEKPSFSSLVHKIDFAASEAAVHQDQARRAAVKGPTTSATNKEMAAKILQERDMQLRARGVNVDELAARQNALQAEGDFMITTAAEPADVKQALGALKLKSAEPADNGNKKK